MSTWTVSNCEFNANFLTFLDLYHLLFALETIGFSWIITWWLIFEKKPSQFWREIWIWVVVILLQLDLSISACNVLVTEDKSLFTLSNVGTKRNCSLTAVLAPINLKLIQFEIGKPFSNTGLTSMVRFFFVFCN